MTIRSDVEPTGTAAPPRPPVALLALTLGVAAVLVLNGRLAQVLHGQPGAQLWLTVLVAISLQALPFLVLGVLISAAIALVPLAPPLSPVSWPHRPHLPHLPRASHRLEQREAPAAILVAALSGALLPGCECASVPVAGSLMSRGVRPAVALTFMLSAPAVNPVVLTSTAVAFAGQPRMVLARFLASLLASVTVGLIWLRAGRGLPIRVHPRESTDLPAWDLFTSHVRHEFLRSGGFLVLGAAAAATAKVAIPPGWLDLLGGDPVLAVIEMGALAFAVALCSSADAFVAASMTPLPLTARLAFMVVGPAVDLKLVALQAGAFGRRFAVRFGALCFAVTVAAAALVGTLLL